MRRLAPYLAAIAIYAVTPGSAQLTEQAIHLIATGHTAHAIPDAEHEPDGAEHGCSATLHVCPCHHAPNFLAGAIAATTPEPTAARTEPPLGPAEPAADPHGSGLFRPPIARS